MKLLKSAWRLLVGVKDALALLFLLVFFGACFALLSFSPSVGELRGGALLASLDGSLVAPAYGPGRDKSQEELWEIIRYHRQNVEIARTECEQLQWMQAMPF